MHKIYISSKDTNARLQEIDLNDIKSNDDCNDIIYINKIKQNRVSWVLVERLQNHQPVYIRN